MSWARTNCAPVVWGQAIRPDHELAGHPVRVSVAVGGALGEHLPDHHQQFAGDGDDSLGFARPSRQALELGVPVRVVVDGGPGGLHQGPAQVLAALLGDVAGLVGLPAVMDTGPEGNRIYIHSSVQWSSEADHRGGGPFFR